MTISYNTSMASALHIITRVLPGKRVEVSSEQLREGDAVEVIVRPKVENNSQQSAIEIIETSHQQGSGRSVEEINRHVQEERNSWDR